MSSKTLNWWGTGVEVEEEEEDDAATASNALNRPLVASSPIEMP